MKSQFLKHKQMHETGQIGAQKVSLDLPFQKVSRILNFVERAVDLMKTYIFFNRNMRVEKLEQIRWHWAKFIFTKYKL